MSESEVEKKSPKKKSGENLNLDFEASLKELESIVLAMENQKLSLEDSLKYFEKGVVLSEHCAKALQSAELKIKTISQKAQSSHADPL